VNRLLYLAVAAIVIVTITANNHYEKAAAQTGVSKQVEIQEEPEPIIIEREAAPEPTAEKEELEYIGVFTVYAYSLDYRCCGKYPDHPEYGITKSGAHVQEGLTIASDWSVLPEGSEVYIEGIGQRVVHDTGKGIKVNKIDVFVGDYQAAKEFGVKQLEVWAIK